jgi:hypothetical protein
MTYPEIAAIADEPTAAIAARPTRIWRALWVATLTWWAIYSLFKLWVYVAHPESQATIFADLRLYRLASLAWLQGGDPWGNLGMHLYAAPPPSLLFMAPFALIPEAIAVPLFEALLVGAVVWALRRFDLPWWFIAWPPIVDNLLVGSPNAMLVALVVVAGPLAVFAKVFAVFPLIGERKWRGLMVTVLLLVVTAPLLPWGLYVSHAADLAEVFRRQSAALSAWGTPLLPLAAIAVASLGLRAAGWLSVPALWPMTQLTYNVLALPYARSPLIALGMSIPIPLVAPLAVIAHALVTRARQSGKARDQLTHVKSPERSSRIGPGADG